LTDSLSAGESEWAVPCPAIVCWISAVRASGGKKAAAGSWARLQVLQP